MRRAHGSASRGERRFAREHIWQGAMVGGMQQRRGFSRVRAAVKLCVFGAALAGVLVLADRRDSPQTHSPVSAVEPSAPQDIAIDSGRDTPVGGSAHSIPPEGANGSVAPLPGHADAPSGAADVPREVPAIQPEDPLAHPALHPQRVVAVRRGDTLMDILLGLGLPRAEAHEAVSALASVYDLRGLRPGQEITFTFAPGLPGEGQPLLGAWMSARADRDVGLARNDRGRFVAHQHDKELTLQPTRAMAHVSSSLYEAGLAAGIPAQVIVDMIRAFSFDVDFQREVQPGDSFELFFDRFVDGDGKVAKTGEIRFASLVLSGRRLSLYRHADRDGHADFFNEKGESVRKALLKTPIDGARLTSGFGNRSHPILGYSAFHKGVDFGAPTGTPIQAAGDGIVEKKGWFGGYGNYVRLKHNSEFATAYAHMSRFSPGIAEGSRVRQGQVIGYVGSTGMSTGPHLHYEILKRGAQVNPMGVKFPTGRKLEGVDLVNFRHAKARIDQAFAGATAVLRVAAKLPGQAEAQAALAEDAASR
jgi:murein DD-endopeptidase MepM/ murein hydrolase activator NlpD